MGGIMWRILRRCANASIGSKNAENRKEKMENRLAGGFGRSGRDVGAATANGKWKLGIVLVAVSNSGVSAGASIFDFLFSNFCFLHFSPVMSDNLVTFPQDFLCGAMVQRLARGPFKAEIRVRFPLALPKIYAA